MFVVFVLYRVGSALSHELITCPEESYRHVCVVVCVSVWLCVCVCVWSRNLNNEAV